MPTATADLQSIAVRVRMRRAELGLRQRQLAEAADVSHRTVQVIESGEYRAHASTYGRIAGALELSLDQLLHGKED